MSANPASVTATATGRPGRAPAAARRLSLGTLLVAALAGPPACSAPPALAPPLTDGGQLPNPDACCSPAPGPTLLRSVPSVGPTAGALAIRLLGSGFRADSHVTFGGAAATARLISATELTAELPPRLEGCAHVDIAVQNPDRQQARLPRAFSYRCAQLSFAPRTRHAVGGGPRALATADLDRDLLPDLIIADPDGQRLLSLRGQPDGAFATPVVLLRGPMTSVAVADFDRDGNQDLAVLQGGASSIAVLLGRGDGSFRTAAPVLFPASAAPAWLVAVDLNRDGAPDLAVANAGSNEVAVIPGQGSGAFGALTSYPVGRGPLFLASADVDDNGTPDLLTVNAGSNDGTVLLGKGDGQLSLGGTFAAGRTPHALAIADLDGDGKQDLAVASPGSNSVVLVIGDGDGHFKQGSSLALAAPPYAIAAGDLDGDAVPDLVLAAGGQAFIYRGMGSGGFATPFSLAVGQDAPALLVADINGDTRPDLLLPGGPDGDISVLRNSSR